MLQHLTEAQRSAVEHIEGPLLILAGAGTGKTRTLTHRIAHLVENNIVEPKQIMAVTFARKASLEMAVRLETILTNPASVREINIGTFHALSGSLLRESLDPAEGPELLPEAGQIDLIRKIIKELSLAGPDWQPSEVLRKISLAKGRLLSPEDLSPDGESQLAAVYRLYQRSLQEKHLVDFDDLIGALVLRWEEDAEVLSRHQRFFKFVLVDEFQDINEAQYRWLQLLTGAHRNLCVVGDTDQSIYGFRGSNVSIFQRFQVDFPEARVIKLEQNFRSSQNILEAAGGLIAHNENPLTCKLWSENGPGPLLRVGRLADEEREAQFVVGEIERLLGGSSHYQIYRGCDTDTPDDTPYGFGDFAVLYRTHAQSRPLADRLSRAGIPFQVVGEKPPFASQAADALLSYLHYAMDTSSIEDLRVILNLPPRGLGEKAQKWLDEEIDKGKFPWEILRLASKNLELPVRQQAAMDHLRRTIVSLQKLLATLPLSDALEKAWEETGLRQYYQEGGKSAAESFKWLRLLAGLHGNKPATETIFSFLDDLSQWRAGDFFDSRADAVALMTLHAAKGLEFPVIFICGLEQDLLPLSHKNQGEDALQEERRLFYVGMTRARHLLVLSTVNRRLLYGELHTRQPSPFIKEIPNQFLEEVSKPASKKKRPSKEKQLTLF